MSNVNTRWFKDRLADKRLSQRQLAKNMGLDPSAISLMLKGGREMKMTEAPQIARLLGVPVSDVLANAGLKIEDGARSIPIVGYIDGAGEAHLDWNASEDRITGPSDLPQGTVAVQFRTVVSEWDMYDGWLAFTTPPGNTMPQDCIGRLCIVGLKDGIAVLRFVRRGYLPGTYNLVNLGVPNITNAEFSWATPVLLIKPS